MIESTMSIGPAASVILFMITLIGAGVIYRLMRDRIMYEIVTLKRRDRDVEEKIVVTNRSGSRDVNLMKLLKSDQGQRELKHVRSIKENKND